MSVSTSGVRQRCLARHAFTSRRNAPTRNTPEPHDGSSTRSRPVSSPYGIAWSSSSDAKNGGVYTAVLPGNEPLVEVADDLYGKMGERVQIPQVALVAEGPRLD